jgi:hypothetical protein
MWSGVASLAIVYAALMVGKLQRLRVDFLVRRYERLCFEIQEEIISRLRLAPRAGSG